MSQLPIEIIEGITIFENNTNGRIATTLNQILENMK